MNTAIDVCPSWCVDEHAADPPGEGRCHFGVVVAVGDVEGQIERVAGGPTRIWISAAGDGSRLSAGDARGLAHQLRRLADVADAGELRTKVPLEADYTLDEVAASLRISTRWIRDRIRLDGAAHQRYGRKIRFTEEQVAGLRAMHGARLVREPVTRGPAKWGVGSK